jgi:hypothetical protein
MQEKNHNIKIGDKSSESMTKLEKSGTILTNQKRIKEEIESRLDSGNACFSSLQNRFSGLLAKNIKIKIYRNLIVPFVLHGCEIWSLILRE